MGAEGRFVCVCLRGEDGGVWGMQLKIFKGLVTRFTDDSDLGYVFRKTFLEFIGVGSLASVKLDKLKAFSAKRIQSVRLRRLFVEDWMRKER